MLLWIQQRQGRLTGIECCPDESVLTVCTTVVESTQDTIQQYSAHDAPLPSLYPTLSAAGATSSAGKVLQQTSAPAVPPAQHTCPSSGLATHASSFEMTKPSAEAGPSPVSGSLLHVLHAASSFSTAGPTVCISGAETVQGRRSAVQHAFACAVLHGVVWSTPQHVRVPVHATECLSMSLIAWWYH